MNEKNLITADQLTPETRKERGREGGKASGRSRKKKAELRKAMQALLDKKYDTDTGRRTGAEQLALTIYSEAMTPESKNWSKAIDTIMQLTDTSPKDQLELAKLQGQLEIMKSNDAFWSVDPFSRAIQAYIEASQLMDGGAEIRAIVESTERDPSGDAPILANESGSR